MENAIVYDALHKRKIFLDAFGKGLEALGVLKFLQKFPEVMKPAFVSSGTVSTKDVLEIMKPQYSSTSVEERKVYEFLLEFVGQCTDENE